MNGIKFHDQTNVIGKPNSMTADECYDLPIKVTTHGRFPAIESVFELSDDELALINKTKRIRLGIVGRGMPPVYLAVEPPAPINETADNAATGGEEIPAIETTTEPGVITRPETIDSATNDVAR